MSIPHLPMPGKPPTAASRQRLTPPERDALARLITPDEMSQVHAGLRWLADDDGDRATVRNDRGFGRYDNALGHELANCPRLTRRQAVLGAHLLHKYRRQVPDYQVWEALLDRLAASPPTATIPFPGSPSEAESMPDPEPPLWTPQWAQWFTSRHHAALTRVVGDRVVAEDATVWARLLADALGLGWYHDDLYGLQDREDPLYGPAGGVADTVTAIANTLRAGGMVVEKSVARAKDVETALRMILPRPADGDWIRWDRVQWNRHRGIPFVNGLLDLDTLSLRDLTPDDRATWRLPYRWVGTPDEGISPTAAQFWLTHFRTLFGDSEEAQIKTRTLLVRSAVAVAPWIRGAQWQKALLLIGPGQNGKGTWIRLWMTILGSLMQSLAVSAYDDRNRFGLTNLKPETLVAATPDMDEAAKLHGTERWKKLTGDDPMDWERKNRDIITTQFQARVWMAGPVVPKVQDRSNGMYRRLRDTIILFDRQQPEDEGYETRMQTTENVEALLVLAVTMLHQVVTGQAPMPVPRTAGGALEDYRRQIDPWEQWIDASDGWLQLDPAGWVATKRLYNVYRHWYQDWTGTRYPEFMPRNKFGAILTAHLGAVAKRGAQAERGYIGVRIHPEYDKMWDDD